jgi:hypothetical protein
MTAEMIAKTLVQLNDRWRVIDDSKQWILQYRRNYRGRSDGSEDPRSWEGKRFCRTRNALLRDIRENCGEVDPAAVAILVALPDWHPDRDKRKNPAATWGSCRVLNHSWQSDSFTKPQRNLICRI